MATGEGRQQAYFLYLDSNSVYLAILIKGRGLIVSLWGKIQQANGLGHNCNEKILNLGFKHSYVPCVLRSGTLGCSCIEISRQKSSLLGSDPKQSDLRLELFRVGKWKPLAPLSCLCSG